MPGGRNKRSVWTVPSQPYSGAHFATFPVGLVEPCVLASTSAYGVCPDCGAPWKRILKPSERYARHLGKSYHDHSQDSERGMMQAKHKDFHAVSSEYITTDWQPTCRCDAGEPAPATVLDPFCGSGTVGEVCRKFGREFIGLDLNMKYLRDQALARAEGVTPESILKTLPMFRSDDDE